MHYQEFIKRTQYPDYKNKYHLAKRILKRKPKVVELLKKKLRILEKKYGYSLSELQMIYRGTDDLNSIFPIGNAPQPTMARMLNLQIDLEEFANEIEELVDDNIGGGLGL